MLVRFFRKDSIDVVVVLVLLMIVVWAKSLLGMVEVEPERLLVYGTPFELLINKFTSAFPMLSAYAAFLFMVIVILMMQSLNNQFIFIPQRSFLPSILFLVIGFGFVSLQHLTPALASLPVIILSLRFIFSSYRKDYAEGDFFLASFFMAVASVVYLPALAFLVAIIFSIIIMRPFSWREWVSLLAGLLVPFIFLAVYYLFFDRGVYDILVNINPSKIVAAIPKRMNSFFGYGFLSIIGLSFIFATLFMLGWSGSQKVRTNKIFLVFYSLVVVAMLTYLLIPTASKEILVIMALPLSYIVGVHLIFARKTFLSDVLLLSLLFVAALLQIYIE